MNKKKQMNTKEKISAGAGALAGSLLLPGKGLLGLACKAVIGGATQVKLVPAVRSLLRPPKAATVYEKKNEPPPEPKIKINPLPLVFYNKKEFQSEHGTWIMHIQPEWKQFFETSCYPNGPFTIHVSITNENNKNLYLSPQELEKTKSIPDEYTPLYFSDEFSEHIMTVLEKPQGVFENVFIQ